MDNLPPGGFYRVEEGETLGSIAGKFGLDTPTLQLINNVGDPRTLRAGQLLKLPGIGPNVGGPGQRLRIGGGRSTYASADGETRVGAARALVGRILWPVPRGAFSSRFGARSGSFHEGIDMAAPEGTAVYAAHSGRVVYAGSGMNGYGKLVAIQSSQLLTVYGHNSELLVERGAYVRRGALIARVGHSGRATGNHLHFETRVRDARRRWVAVDPVIFFRGC